MNNQKMRLNTKINDIVYNKLSKKRTYWVVLRVEPKQILLESYKNTKFSQKRLVEYKLFNKNWAIYSNNLKGGNN